MAAILDNVTNNFLTVIHIMDTELCVTLWQVDGDAIPVTSKSSDSLRSVIAASRISVPPNSRIMCVSRGTRLHLDLSLGVQGITENDNIVVVCKQKRRDTGVGNREGGTGEIRDRQLWDEVLRMADLSFLFYERCPARAKRSVDAAILDCPGSVASEDAQKGTAICDQADHMSCDALPVCWGTAEFSASDGSDSP